MKKLKQVVLSAMLATGITLCNGMDKNNSCNSDTNRENSCMSIMLGGDATLNSGVNSSQASRAFLLFTKIMLTAVINNNIKLVEQYIDERKVDVKDAKTLYTIVDYIKKMVLRDTNIFNSYGEHTEFHAAFLHNLQQLLGHLERYYNSYNTFNRLYTSRSHRRSNSTAMYYSYNQKIYFAVIDLRLKLKDALKQSEVPKHINRPRQKHQASEIAEINETLKKLTTYETIKNIVNRLAKLSPQERQQLMIARVKAVLDRDIASPLPANIRKELNNYSRRAMATTLEIFTIIIKELLKEDTVRKSLEKLAKEIAVRKRDTLKHVIFEIIEASEPLTPGVGGKSAAISGGTIQHTLELMK